MVSVHDIGFANMHNHTSAKLLHTQICKMGLQDPHIISI